MINGTTTTTPTGSAAPTAPAKPAGGLSALADQNTFLKLLVAQIRNQNPLSPTDGLQFMTQLAQFSELEQMMQMRGDIGAIKTTIDKHLPSTTTTSGTPAGTPAGSTDPSTNKP